MIASMSMSKVAVAQAVDEALRAASEDAEDRAVAARWPQTASVRRRRTGAGTFTFHCALDQVMAQIEADAVRVCQPRLGVP
jgi:hypothetical protein